MIKINLLLARKEKKKVGMKKEVIIAGLSVVVMVMLFGILYWKAGEEKEEIQQQISKTRDEIARYQSLSTEVNKAKEAQKILQDKLNVINTLRKEKSGPARVLDELSIEKPEKMQFESLKKEGLKIGIEGIALDDETVANFMTSLRKSKMFKNVDLIVSELSEQSKIKLKKFNLSCDIILM